jgi:hypothetical protein
MGCGGALRKQIPESLLLPDQSKKKSEGMGTTIDSEA